MDFEFFDGQGDTVVDNQNVQQQNVPAQEQDDFDFGDQSQPQQYQIPSYDQNPSYVSQEEDENVKRMREEQERIHEQLREKANKEYELKQERKQAARKQLQEFMEQKQRQKDERRAANAEKEAKRRNEIANQTSEQGWKKVASNVALKQGEHPGRKDINRMREAILNKKGDETR